MECMRLQSTKLPNYHIIVAILLFKWGKNQQYKNTFTLLIKKLSSNQIKTSIPQLLYTAKSTLGLNSK